MVSRLCWILLWSSAAPAAPPRPRFLVRKHLEKHEKNNAQDKENIQKTQSWAESPLLAAPCHKKVPKRYQKQPRRATGTQKGDTRTPKRPQTIPKGAQRAPEASQKAPKSKEKTEKMPRRKLIKTSPFRNV